MNPRLQDELDLPLHPTMRHPLTGNRLRAIARNPKTGSLVWPIMGGAPTPPKDDQWAKVFEGKTPEQVKQELDAAAAKATTADEWDKTFKGKKPDEIKAASQQWEKRARRSHKDSLALAELKETLGLKPGDDDPNDDKGKKGKSKVTESVATKLASKDAKAADLTRENAVLRLASDLGANPRSLVDSRRFMDKLAKLDPTADDFEEKIEKRIEKALAGTGGDRFAATAGSSDGRPKRDPRQGRQSKGKTGTTESGRTAYAERRKQRQAGRISV